MHPVLSPCVCDINRTSASFPALQADIKHAVTLLEIVLQNCRGRVDEWVEPYIGLCLAKLKGEAPDSSFPQPAFRRVTHAFLPARRSGGHHGVASYCLQHALHLCTCPAVAETRSLSDALLVVIANCLYYNAPLTLAALQRAGALQGVFSSWFAAIFKRKKNGKAPHHFRRAIDKKVRTGRRQLRAGSSSIRSEATTDRAARVGARLACYQYATKALAH